MSADQDRAGGIKALFVKKLAGSRIDEATAKKLKLTLCEASKAPAWLPFAAGGFRIPYFTAAGKLVGFERYRYLEEPERNGFAALVEHKAIRYVQPKGTDPELYLPPLLDWEVAAADPARQVLITEGELKAACATRVLELPTIGLGGVWSFRCARKNIDLLPALEAFRWDGRIVTIVFDSDASSNPQVCAAEGALARELAQRGATVNIARLPPDGGNKVGIDDYLLTHSKAEGLAVLAAAEGYAAIEELLRLNEEVVYVRNPGFVLRTDTGQRIDPGGFHTHAYSTRKLRYQAADGTTKMKSAAKEWLSWPYRAEVERLTYAPGQPRRMPDGSYNAWRGWGVEPVKGETALWRKLLAHLFGDDKASRDWFEKWLAYPLQHPGTKLYTSVLLHGLAHGTGKSFVGYSMFKIYGDNSTEITNKHLHGNHNEWAENKQFVMGDEISSGDKRAESDSMKTLITQARMRLNPKFIPSYEVPDCINYYFTSNHVDGFFLENGDRRNFIHEVTAPPMPFEFYKEYENWIGKPHVNGPGASALFYHLLHLPLDDFEPRGHAPVTKSKLEMIALGRSDLADWVSRLKESPDSVLRFGLDKKPIPYCLWTSADLLAIYDPDGRTRVTPNGMTREMRRAGFREVCEGRGCPTQLGLKKMFEVRPMIGNVLRNRPVSVGARYDRERFEPYTKGEKYK